MSSSGVTTVSGWTSFIWIIACFFTASVPWGETIDQPQGHVPTAPMQVVSMPIYLSPETRMSFSMADSPFIAEPGTSKWGIYLDSQISSNHAHLGVNRLKSSSKVVDRGDSDPGESGPQSFPPRWVSL